MNYQLFSIILLGFITFASAEIVDHLNANKEFQVHDKDLKDAKERWIQEEDWGDDMMQHPIDEGPRRVSL